MDEQRRQRRRPGIRSAIPAARARVGQQTPTAARVQRRQQCGIEAEADLPLPRGCRYESRKPPVLHPDGNPKQLPGEARRLPHSFQAVNSAKDASRVRIA